MFIGVDKDTVGMLRRLKERGVLMLAHPNANRTHHEVSSWRFADALDEVHCSHELGCRKPEPEVFRRVLDEHGPSASEVVIVDDVDGHVEAAQAAGLRAVVFTGEATLKRQLDELETGSDA